MSAGYVQSNIKDLCTINTYRFLFSIAIEYLVIFISIGIAFYSHYTIFICVIAVCIIGTRQYALFSLLHEALHYNISRKKKFNDTVGKLFLSIPLFIDFDKMRKVHLMHHKHLHTQQDPELSILQYKSFHFPKTKIQLVLLFLGDLLGINYSIILAKTFLNKSLKSKLLFTVLSALLIFFLFKMNILQFVFVFWILPYITIFQFLNRLRLATEHFNIPDAKFKTRSMHTNWIENLIFNPYSIGYHHEHHKYPAVPYYNLHKLYINIKDVESENMYLEKSYLTLFVKLLK